MSGAKVRLQGTHALQSERSGGMFSVEEAPLISGRAADVEAFVNTDTCLIVDPHHTADDVLGELIRFLPPDTFTYRFNRAPDGTISVQVRFLEREDHFTLPLTPLNNIRILLRAWQLLLPDFDIKLFRFTESSDEFALLLRSSEWWEALRSQHPKRYKGIFRDAGDLIELCGLSGQLQEGAVGEKSWWSFWR